MKIKFKIYFLGRKKEDFNGKIHCVTFSINGKEYCTADIRVTPGDPEEVTLCTSNTYLKKGTSMDLDFYMDESIEAGRAIMREIEVEPVETEWKPYGISYTIIKDKALIYEEVTV